MDPGSFATLRISNIDAGVIDILSTNKAFRRFELPAKLQTPDDCMTKETMSWTCLMWYGHALAAGTFSFRCC
jgi:hypothetical protein